MSFFTRWDGTGGASSVDDVRASTDYYGSSLEMTAMVERRHAGGPG